MSNDQKIESYNTKILREKNGYLVCREHPTYGVIHPPRINCPGCWELYNMKNQGMNKDG